MSNGSGSLASSQCKKKKKRRIAGLEGGGRGETKEQPFRSLNNNKEGGEGYKR